MIGFLKPIKDPFWKNKQALELICYNDQHFYVSEGPPPTSAQMMVVQERNKACDRKREEIELCNDLQPDGVSSSPMELPVQRQPCQVGTARSLYPYLAQGTLIDLKRHLGSSSPCLPHSKEFGESVLLGFSVFGQKYLDQGDRTKTWSFARIN